jgi:TPR repeat protein/AcrR family transcriptional regulator
LGVILTAFRYPGIASPDSNTAIFLNAAEIRRPHNGLMSRAAVDLTRPFLRERCSARRALLEAARRIAERDGLDAITLGNAADEAGFARTTAYANFSGRDELLQGVVADDLSILLRTMRQAIGYPEPPSFPLPPSRIVRVAFQRADEGSDENSDMPVAAALNDGFAVAGDTLEPLELAVEEESWAEAPNDGLDGPGDRAIRPDASHATVAPAPELLQRLAPVAQADADSVEHLERKVVLLEGRINILEEDLKSALQTIAANGSPPAEPLDAFEEKQSETIADITAEIGEIHPTLDETGSAPQPSQAESIDVDDDFPLVVSDVVVDDSLLPEESASEIADRHGSPESQPKPPIVVADFLSQARRAALSAESSGLSSALATTKRKKYTVRTRLTLVAVCAGAMAFTSITIAFRYHVSQIPPAVVSHAPGQAFASASAKHVRPSVPLTAPIDQLTAQARAGAPDAELAVGLKYLAGEDAAKNETEGAGWISRSALQGDTLAQYWLANLYEHGRGVASDPVQAFAWYEKAALGGNRKAMHNLAVAYAQGSGVAKNMEEAARWFSKAATLGYVDSAFNLGVLYERGDGVPQSLLDAYKWYAIAANQGDAESKVRMSAMAGELPPDALAAAQKAAESFKPDQTGAVDLPKSGALR